jgi:hypothetical protein
MCRRSLVSSSRARSGWIALGDVAEQPTDGVRRKLGSGLYLRSGRRRGLSRVLQAPGDLSEHRLLDRHLQLIELLVQQADLLLVSHPERSQRRLGLRDLRAALAEYSFELGQPRLQTVHAVVPA